MNEACYQSYMDLLSDPNFKSKEAKRLSETLTHMLRDPDFSHTALYSSEMLPRLSMLLNQPKPSIIELVSEYHDLIKESPTSRIELEIRDRQTGEALYNIFIKAPVAN